MERCYSIPADFKMDNILKMDELNQKFEMSKIKEVYGQITEGGGNSGRSIDTLPKVDRTLMKNYVRVLNDYNINFNYTFNQSCWSNREFLNENIIKIKSFVKWLADIGVTDITVALPPLIELIHNVAPQMNIKASAICEINSVHKALFYKNLGVTRIVADPDIVRRFDVLKAICDSFGQGVEIIVTNMCHNSCPYKMFHYNHTAHKRTEKINEAEKYYYENRCFLQYAEKVTGALKLNWVRPEDINLYAQIGVTNFKFDGRDHVLKGDYIKTLYHYFVESYDGNLFDLLYFFAQSDMQMRYLDNRKLDGFVEGFYKNPSMCTGICEKCGYCEKFVSIDKYSKVFERAKHITLLNLKKTDAFLDLIERA